MRTARAEHRIIRLPKIGLLIVGRAITPTSIAMLRGDQALNRRFNSGHGFRQATVEKRKFPTQDVAVGRRCEKARSAIAQHIASSQFDVIAGLTAAFRICRDPSVHP
jgi:hypothetical protein